MATSTAGAPSSTASSQPTATRAPHGTAGTVNACTLLTAEDASTLGGVPMTAATAGDAINCHYQGPGGPAAHGAEITVRVDADAATAHADFPRWVQPVAGNTPGFTVTQVSGLADEASETHTDLGTTHLDGIFFRLGAVLVKIGVNPSASDTALNAAATTVLGRL